MWLAAIPGIAKAISAIAPGLGKMLGGDKGEQVGGVIADVLGLDESMTPEELQAKIADNANVIKLAELENSLEEMRIQSRVRMRENELFQVREQTKTHHADRVSARNMAVAKPQDKTARNLAYAAILQLFIISIYLLFEDVPDGNSELVYLIIGAMIGYAGQGFTFFLGSSDGSKQKQDLLHKLADDEEEQKEMRQRL